MLTARIGEINQLIMLELGAHDCIHKPFSPRIVVAHVCALLRCSEAAKQLISVYQQVGWGDPVCSYTGLKVKFSTRNPTLILKIRCFCGSFA
jgi:DNA-binding response OmpR family regulator